MPYVKMIKTLPGIPQNTCSQSNHCKQFEARKTYNLPRNLFAIWQEGIDYVLAVNPADYYYKLPEEARHHHKVKRAVK